MSFKIIQNDGFHSTELHYDEKEIASWSKIDIPEESIVQIEQMLSYAFKEGKESKTREIRNLLTGKNDEYWKR